MLGGAAHLILEVDPSSLEVVEVTRGPYPSLHSKGEDAGMFLDLFEVFHCFFQVVHATIMVCGRGRTVKPQFLPPMCYQGE